MPKDCACPATTVRSFNAYSTGYSLIELLIAIVIVSILSVSVVNLWKIIERSRISATLNNTMASLSFARSEAIRRGDTLTICQSPDGVDCGRSNQWERGWLVVVDKDRNIQVDPEDEIVLKVGPLPENYTLRWNGSLGTDYYLRYFASGNSNKVGTFTLCGPHGAENARAIILYRTGRARSAREKSDGRALECTGGGV